MLDEKLLAILACPKCKGDLKYTGDELQCHACKLAYRVEDDMPIMVIEKARRMEEKPPGS